MAFEDVTPAYVDLLSNNKYASRTSNSTEFDGLKNLYSVYLNSNPNFLPDRKYTHGLALLILHHYALDDTQNPDSGGDDKFTGSKASERVGDVSITYGGMPSYASDLQGWKAWIGQTQWGMQFLYLMKTFKPTPLVI